MLQVSRVRMFPKNYPTSKTKKTRWYWTCSKPLFFKAPRLLCEVSEVTNDLISSEFVGPVIQVSSAQHFRQAFANSTLEANVRNSVCFVKTAWLKVETRKYIVLCFFSTMNNNHNISVIFCLQQSSCKQRFLLVHLKAITALLQPGVPDKNLLVLFPFRQVHWVVFVGVTHLSLLPMVCALLTSRYLSGSFERKRSSARPEANLGEGFLSNQYWTLFDWVVNQK